VWHPQDRLDNGILQIPVDVIAEWPEMVFRPFQCKQKIVLFEFPHPSFFKVLAEAHASGWITFYDVVDDWKEFQRVGQAMWYDPQFEIHLLSAVDAVTVVNPHLAREINLRGHKNAALIPNGLIPGVEKIDHPRAMERGEITIGYFGYLSGAWFDWKLLLQSAELKPNWLFYLIGYGGEIENWSLPSNIKLLGKKPRSELASYASNWDVAIIPFKPESLAKSADPIKTYEYLAMGLPIVVTGVYPPAGSEGFVRRASGVQDFIRSIEFASEKREEKERRKAFANTCTWSKRVDTFLGMIENGDQRIAEKRAIFWDES
jgi:glycosyltransferase involved in cell wall biosynthesis